jgi:hypothetical protein
MSRDPSRELDDFRDALHAKPRRDPEGHVRQHQPAGNFDHSSEQDREIPTPTRPLAPEPRFEDSRSVLYNRDRGYRVRQSEIRTLTDLGKFRVVGTEDLVAQVYSGHRQEMQSDLRNLLRQGLVRKGIFDGPESAPRELLTLTKAGYRLLHANRIVAKDQAIYHGFLKPREANHDADLYLLYQKEATRIQVKGGRPVRVVLDLELQSKINRDFATFGTEARNEIAARHGLQVVWGKIPVPDMRIEYKRPDGEIARVDLELVTEHYAGRSIADKARAGFSLYTPRGESDRLRRVLDQRELTAEILSL